MTDNENVLRSIKKYAQERADLFFGPLPSWQKEEFIKSVIKKNMRHRNHESRSTNPEIDVGFGIALGKSTSTHSHHGFKIQSVLVPKDKFTRPEAIKYIREHFAYKKIDPTQRKNFYSFRQFDPTKNSKSHCIGIADGSVYTDPNNRPLRSEKYFTKILDNDVELVFEKTPIGKDSIKPKEPAMVGGSFKVHEIYKFIKNGHLEGYNREKIAGYTFLEELSGKHFQVYQNKNKKIIVINYSGTREMSDWLNNFDYLFRTYNISVRYKNARAILETVLKDYPKYQIKLIGYSQSGIIVRELAKLYGDEIFEIISLNPGNLSVYEDKAPDNEYVIKSDLDFASYFRRPEPNDIIIPAKTSNLATEHLPEILFRLNPDLVIGRKK